MRAVENGSVPVFWNGFLFVDFANFGNLLLSEMSLDVLDFFFGECSASDKLVTSFGEGFLNLVELVQNNFHFGVHIGVLLLLLECKVIESDKLESLLESEFLDRVDDLLLVLNVFFIVWIDLIE